MDINKLFSSFEDDSLNDDTTLLVDFSEHPLYWISGFIKVINNYTFFTKLNKKNFSKIDPSIKIEEIEKISDSLLYDKAWNYIKNIKLDNILHLDSLKVKTDDKLISSLVETIIYFESIEEYEKCAFLKKIEDKVREFNLSLALI
jgi:hypothetical protein